MEALLAGLAFGVVLFLVLWFPYWFQIPVKSKNPYEDYGYPYDSRHQDDRAGNDRG